MNLAIYFLFCFCIKQPPDRFFDCPAFSFSFVSSVVLYHSLSICIRHFYQSFSICGADPAYSRAEASVPSGQVVRPVEALLNV